MTAASAVTTTLEDIDVECTHCGVKLTSHLGSGATVRYFRCSSCHRWVSSAYTEVFRADTKLRPHRRRDGAPREDVFHAVKNRLERWLAALEDQDPYRTLGVSPLDSPERIRARFRELALANHPDRGGSPDAMREVNAAFESIIRHRARQRAEALPAGSTPLHALT